MHQLRKLAQKTLRPSLKFYQQGYLLSQIRLSQSIPQSITYGFSQNNKEQHFFNKQSSKAPSDEDESPQVEEFSEETELEKEADKIEPIKQIIEESHQKQQVHQIIKVPATSTNAYELGQLFAVDSLEILHQIQVQSKEMVIDEFQDISPKVIEQMAVHFEKEIELVYDHEYIQKNYKPRPPVVTIMGHVDHGKTTLLDAFRHSQKVKEEYGDITQSIGAFTFRTDSDHEITFIDTPGHEAFQNLRVRGAKVTDMIILVISAIESIQPQTIEVIKLAQNLHIPVIVAVNKIDRTAADIDQVLLDLANYEMVVEELGGEVPSVPISAKLKINLDKLEEKIIEVAQTKLDLNEDFSCKAQCYVIESNFDEKTTQITASVLIKKGVLRQEDIFVCGVNEGRVRFMKNDQGKNVKLAYPGQAVHLGGFRAFPEVGLPLYGCKDHEEAQFIASRIKSHRDRELVRIQQQQQAKSELKKDIKGLTRMERRRLHGGDKTIMYEKMGLIEEEDIEKYRKKLGISKGIDFLSKDIDEIEELAENAASEQMKVGSKSKFFKRKRNVEFNKEEFKKIVKEYQEEHQRKELMTPQELAKYEQERSKLKEVYRGEDLKHFPIMIKASSAGVLETLLKEAEKVVGTQNYRISIIDYSVGPITEGDMNSALQTGAIIFGFDVPCNPMVMRGAEPQGVIIRQHKIIYKFLEDMENFVYDANTKIQEESGKAVHVEVLAKANVSQVFKVKDPKSKSSKPILVAGCKVSDGDLERKFKYRLSRNGKVIQDNLKLHSMKKLQEDVTLVQKGHECGLSFENLEHELTPGDVVEAYKELEGQLVKFHAKPGVHQSY